MTVKHLWMTYLGEIAVAGRKDENDQTVPVVHQTAPTVRGVTVGHAKVVTTRLKKLALKYANAVR